MDITKLNTGYLPVDLKSSGNIQVPFIVKDNNPYFNTDMVSISVHPEMNDRFIGKLFNEQVTGCELTVEEVMRQLVQKLCTNLREANEYKRLAENHIKLVNIIKESL